MKKLLQGVAVLSVLCAGTATANEVEYSANVGMVSKYIWRGWNLNDNLSGQGGFDLGYKGFSAGVWGGTDEAAGTEYDLYVGYGSEINDKMSFNVGYIQYRYPEVSNHVAEWHATLDFNFASATVHKGEDDYMYYEINGTYNINDQWAIDLHYGYEDNGNWDWQDGQIKLTYQINQNYSVYIAAADKERNDENVYAGIFASF